MKDLNLAALSTLEELTDSEMDSILGAEGVIKTISHECHMNSFQWFFGCCW